MTDDLGSTLWDITARLDAAGIPYMVVGSIAAAMHGRARSTMDVDIVIEPTAASLRAFVDGLPSDIYYVSLEAAVDALRRRSQFNVLDLGSGWKIVLLIRTARPFSIEEFARRAPHPGSGRPVVAASLEDVLLAKLEWARIGASERQLEDCRALVELAGERLDLAYVQRQVAALGVEEQWTRVRS